MVTISFFIKPMLSSLLKHLSLKWWDKLKIKIKIKKISDFLREYDDTFVDSYRFQQVLNSDEVKNLIFTFIFGSTFTSISKAEFIKQLTRIALDDINSYRKKQALPLIYQNDDITNYFKDLIDYLEGIRDKEFSYKESSFISNIQNSIVESNNNLKISIEKYLIDFNENKYLESISENKIKENLERNIKNLNDRYKPNANVDLDLNHYFYAAAHEEKFVCSIREKLINLDSLIMKTSREDDNVHKMSKDLVIAINDFKHIAMNNKNLRIEKDYLKKFINKIEDTKNKYLKYLNDLEKEKNSQKNYVIKDYLLSSYNMMEDLQNLFQGDFGNLLQNPYLIIHGEGGIGKSHLFARNADYFSDNGHEVLLLLGQHFNTNEHPFIQIFKELDFLGKKETFLNELNQRSEKKQKKFIFMIDALNEGNGKNFWKDYLIDFLNLFKNYSNIFVAMSVRSNFVKSILPDDIENKFPVTKIHHNGFLGSSLEDLKPLFEFYNINPLLFPTLNSEAQNPLLLHIYCEVYKEKDFEYNGWNVLQLLNEYTRQINLRISIDKKFEYPSEINLVYKILMKFAEGLYNEKTSIMKIEKFYDIVRGISIKYVSNYQGIINSLYEENIITISKLYNQEEIVYFTYERFSDLYIALYLIEQELEKKDAIKDYLEREESVIFAGITEALSIALPEKFNVEILDFIDNVTDDHKEAFISGLSWRSNNISEKSLYWIDRCLESGNQMLISAIYDEILKQSFIKNSPINGEFLFKHLNSLTMSERDAIWTIYINHSDIPLELLKIINKDNFYSENFSIQNYRLLCSTWGWFLSSTNIHLRDIATKSLTRVLFVEAHLISHIFKLYKNVNDPYILERILASMYGAVLKLKNVYSISELDKDIYNHFFNESKVYPNILIRDYVRGILNVFENKNKSLFDKSVISPPYQSTWYKNEYSLEDVDLKLKEIQFSSKKEYTGFEKIVRSMTTEYGRGTGSYGDFGRYTFGYALSDWSNQFNDQELSNIAVMRILEYGYSEQLHGNYDVGIQEHSRHQNFIERIGKKYQWISLFELLAKITDNFPIIEKINVYTQEYQKQQDDLNKKIMKMIQEGIYFKDIDQINYDVDDEGDKNLKEQTYLTEAESILHVETRISKYYDGPWMFYMRNIDPSKVDDINKKNSTFTENFLPQTSDAEWAKTKTEIENIVNFIKYNYDSNEYISLGQMLSQKRKHQKGYEFYDEFFVKSKALLVSKEKMHEYLSIKTKEKKNLSVNWPNKIQGFLFEHYDSPFFYKRANFEDMIELNLATNAIWEYSWERNTDFSLDDKGSNYLLPCYEIVENLKLYQASEGIWKDETDSVVSLDVASLGFENNLLIKNEKLCTFLEKNNFELTWDFYIEKKSNGIYKRYWIMVWFENNELDYQILEEE